MKYHFLMNARAMTLDRAFYTQSRCQGYLFPPDAASAAVVDSLTRRTRVRVISDNGGYDEIGRLAVKAGSLRPESGWPEVMALIRHEARLVGGTEVLKLQLSVHPDAIIGIEDITLASWLRAGTPETLLRSKRRELAEKNRRVAEAGLALQKRHPELRVYTVASAHDYDSARDAGAAFGKAGVTSVAVGLGASMADDQWSSSIKLDGHILKLGRKLPTRYSRTASIVRGLFDGWGSSSQQPANVHYLGLGAPIMVPLVALPALALTDLSTDATSPIKDAVGGSVYVNRPAPLSLRTWRIADNLAVNSNARWNCPCPFCFKFMANHPFDRGQLRQLRLARSKPFAAQDLRAEVGIAAPLFHIASDTLGREAERARIGHNHWVLGNVTRAVNSHADDLLEFLERRVAMYERHAGAPQYAAAVRLAFQLLDAKSDFWRRA